MIIIEKISSNQLASLTAVTIISGILLSGGSDKSMQSAFIASLIAVILAGIIYLIYGRINAIFPQCSLFLIVEKVFGKFFGKIIIFLFSLYSIFLGAMSMRIFSEFTQVVSMPETSQLLTLIMFSAVCIYILEKGVGVLAKSANMWIGIIIFFILLINILSVTEWKPYYLLPLTIEKPAAFFNDIWITLVFPLGEVVLLCNLFGFTKQKAKKPLMWGLALGGGILVLEVLRSIVVLGTGTISLLYYPSYTATGIINIMDFFTRVEVLISLSFFIAQIIKVCIALYSASSGLGEIFSAPSYKTLVVPIAFFMVSLASILFKNTADSYEFLQIYKYIGGFFSLLLPTAIWIGAEIIRMRDKALMA